VVDIETEFSKLYSQKSNNFREKLEFFLSNCVTPAHLESLKKLHILPSYFDESVVSSVLNVELEAGNEFCIHMTANGIFDSEPANKDYKRYKINPHVKEILGKQVLIQIISY
jgi:hypothetical protein